MNQKKDFVTAEIVDIVTLSYHQITTMKVEDSNAPAATGRAAPLVRNK